MACGPAQTRITLAASALSLALGAACQVVHPGPTLVLGILPELDPHPRAELESLQLVGARDPQLADPALFGEALPEALAEELEDPRLGLVRSLLQERAPRLSDAECERIAETLVRAERDHGLDAILLLAVIEQESRYDPRVRSPRGALGLMQVRPFVAEDVAQREGLPWYGPQTLHDPELNVKIGTQYFAEMKRMYPDNTIALAAYNMGPYRVKRILAGGRIPSPRYVFEVLERYYALRRHSP